jgi:hypothetical protein
MGFKLGKSIDVLFNKKGAKESFKETAPVYKTKLEEGIKGEANNDGTIFIDESVDLNSEDGRHVLAHEQAHIDQFNTLWDNKHRKIVEEPNENTVALFDYDKQNVYWKGEVTKRKDIIEGAGDLAWEKDAEERVAALYGKKIKNKHT